MASAGVSVPGCEARASVRRLSTAVASDDDEGRQQFASRGRRTESIAVIESYPTGTMAGRCSRTTDSRASGYSSPLAATVAATSPYLGRIAGSGAHESGKRSNAVAG
ncbi:hypothetical protein BRD03_08980 [Halobacteriales archaeon QS_9_68_17]|nr:MAG: hypothetical protein BRD03_08980 [Halobacteriales archaeon QS_9_68_17]